MVCFTSRQRSVLRDGPWRLGREMGTLLEGARVPVKDWPRSDDEPGWKIRLEFRVIATFMLLAAFVFVLSLIAPEPASAHPGGLAADGCHNDHKNGGRHCHRSSSRALTGTPAPDGRGRNGRVYYSNCAAARAAGAAPVRRGDPGYGSHLDRDNDGIGCE